MNLRSFASTSLLLSCGSEHARPHAPSSASPPAPTAAPSQAAPALESSDGPFVVPERAVTDLRCFARSEARGLGACFVGSAGSKKSGEPPSFKLAFVPVRAGATVPASIEVTTTAELSLSPSERTSIGEALRGFTSWTPTAKDENKDGRVNVGKYEIGIISLRYDPNGPVVSTVRAKHADGREQTLGGTTEPLTSFELRAFAGASSDEVVVDWRIRLSEMDTNLSAFSCDATVCSDAK